MKAQEFLNSFVLPHQALVFRGAPGSGKSSLVQELAKRFTRIAHCSADHHRIVNGVYVFDPKKNQAAHHACLVEFTEAARTASQWDLLVCDNTNVNLHEAAPYMAVAGAYDWKPVLVTVAADPEAAAKRNLHGVPDLKVKDMYDRIQRSLPHIPKYWAQITIETE